MYQYSDEKQVFNIKIKPQEDDVLDDVQSNIFAKQEVIIQFGNVFIQHLRDSLDDFKDLLANEIEDVMQYSDNQLIQK